MKLLFYNVNWKPLLPQQSILVSIFSPNHNLQNFCYNAKRKIEKGSKTILKKQGGRYMGDVIPFYERKRKRVSESKSNKKKSKMTAERTASESSSTDVDYAEMKPEQQAEFWKNMEKEKEEKFRIKYKDILSTVPVSAGEKMQYFAGIMLKLIPNIFHGNWNTRFDACEDFCNIYF